MKILFLLVCFTIAIIADNNATIASKLLICENNITLYTYTISGLVTLITGLSAYAIYQHRIYLSLMKENSDNKALATLSKEMTDMQLALSNIGNRP